MIKQQAWSPPNSAQSKPFKAFTDRRAHDVAGAGYIEFVLPSGRTEQIPSSRIVLMVVYPTEDEISADIVQDKDREVMSGNVWEWCWDVFASGERRFCGGCWSHKADRCAFRTSHGVRFPNFRADWLGFRYVRNLSATQSVDLRSTMVDVTLPLRSVSQSQNATKNRSKAPPVQSRLTTQIRSVQLTDPLPTPKLPDSSKVAVIPQQEKPTPTTPASILRDEISFVKRICEYGLVANTYTDLRSWDEADSKLCWLS